MGWRHSVRALVLDPDDRILLCRHKISAPQRIVWAAPGGGVEAGETNLGALRRELHEEIGLTIEAAGNQRLLGSRPVLPRDVATPRTALINAGVPTEPTRLGL